MSDPSATIKSKNSKNARKMIKLELDASLGNRILALGYLRSLRSGSPTPTPAGHSALRPTQSRSVKVSQAWSSQKTQGGPLWSLDFGIFLEFEVWNLEFSPSPSPSFFSPPPSTLTITSTPMYNRKLVFAAACLGMLLFGIVFLSLGSVVNLLQSKFHLDN